MTSPYRLDLLAGKTAFITGGGTGIGKGIALAFARHGAAVVVASRKQQIVEQAALQIGKENGGRARAVACDVRSYDDVARALDVASDAFGGIDIVVNGAAGNFLAPAVSLSSNAFKTVVEIDLQGTFHVCRAAFPHLEKTQGNIINISATLHYVGTPLQAHAVAAKAGVDALTRTLAVEWGGASVRVNVLAPGPINATEGALRLVPEEQRAKMEQLIPLRRFGSVDDVADAALYLASDAARWVTGSVLVVDGGQWLPGANGLLMTM